DKIMFTTSSQCNDITVFTYSLRHNERNSEMGKLLLVVSDNGGVGKSTFVANTGSMLVIKGNSVIILQTDK
ncbi:hypothetical protein ACNIU7_28860, partial [Escherichia coli]